MVTVSSEEVCADSFYGSRSTGVSGREIGSYLRVTVVIPVEIGVSPVEALRLNWSEAE